MQRMQTELNPYDTCRYIQEKSGFGHMETKSVNLFRCEKDLFEAIGNQDIDFVTRLKTAKSAIADILRYEDKNILSSTSHKPSIDAKDSTGWTPLITASCYGQTEIVHLLLEAKANPHVITEDKDYSATHHPSHRHKTCD